MKIRVKFRKLGLMKFVGHLDMVRYFQKAIRRAKIPAAFTKGYNPHIIMSFAHPLGVGLTSEAEYLDIELEKTITSKSAIEQLNEVMAEGVEVVDFIEIAPEKKHAGMSIVAAADYLVPRMVLVENKIDISSIKSFINQESIMVTKKSKRSEKIVDIKPLIYKIDCLQAGLFMQVATGSKENLKPGLVIEALFKFLDINYCKHITYHRTEIYADINSELVPLSELGKEVL